LAFDLVIDFTLHSM